MLLAAADCFSPPRKPMHAVAVEVSPSGLIGSNSELQGKGGYFKEQISLVIPLVC
ncbi:hypothetical protein BVRB_9g207710 [Beta vulgaris subsp. vulgaris]|nr:hypothetical protein BVRB_9g207710 [Beta vulgaris subsp. vulgaris]